MTTSFETKRPTDPVKPTIKTINIEPELISNEEGPAAKIEEAIRSIDDQLERYHYPTYAYLALSGALAHMTLAKAQIKGTCHQAQHEVDLENRQTQTQARQRQKQKLTLVRPDGTVPS